MSANYVEPAKPLSSISIPIAINLNAASRKLNQQFANALYSDNSFEDNGTDNLKVTVSKRNNIQLQFIDKAIQVTCPLHIEGVYRIKTSVLGLDMKREQPLSLNVTAIIRAVPGIDANWNLLMNSQANLIWDDLPVFEFAGMKLDLPKLFSQAIQKQTNQIGDYINKEVPKQVNLKSQVAGNMSNVVAPYQIDEATNSWLALHPKQIALTPFTGNDSILQLYLGMGAVVEVVSGFKPNADDASVLPKIVKTNYLDDKIRIMLNSQIGFEQINKTIQEQLLGKNNQFTGSDYFIQILDAKVYPNGDKLYIGIDLTGWFKNGKTKKKIKGIVYVQGTPFFDPVKQTISVKNFDFDLQTKDLLLKSASWLVSFGPFRKKIENSLTFPIGSELDQAKKMANDALNKQYTNYLNLSGSINKIAPQAIIITPNYLRVDIMAEGNIKVLVNGF